MGGVANTTEDKEAAHDGDGGGNLDKGEKDRVSLGDKGPGSPRGETT